MLGNRNREKPTYLSHLTSHINSVGRRTSKSSSGLNGLRPMMRSTKYSFVSSAAPGYSQSGRRQAAAWKRISRRCSRATLQTLHGQIATGNKKEENYSEFSHGGQRNAASGSRRGSPGLMPTQPK